MGTEIERKYLVVGDSWRADADDGTRIVQGYLSLDPERTVRVRLKGDDRAVLTIKGASDGPTRAEYEYDLPRADAEELLALCLGAVIDKVRYRIVVGALTWELDVFSGDNAGLLLAEVELGDAATMPELPSWAGEEVTSDRRYFNASLVEHPYPFTS